MNKARDNINVVDTNLDEEAITPNNLVNLETLNNIAITPEEIQHTLNSFRQKAPGCDNITKIHLSKAMACIAIPLANCFNAALSCGYFPLLYKHTKLIFAPKPPKKDKTDVANYRPISLLNTTVKLLEKLLNRRLIEHLQDHEQHNKYQHGFRSRRGTETALAMVWEAIAQGRKHKLKVCLTSRDIEKAFDRVWQRGLKYRLTQLTLQPNLTKILSHYLDNRSASIQIEDYEGPRVQIECGVPQGGCLSTTLFNIYTKDIPDKLYPWKHNTYYADDITQIVRGTNYSEISQVWAAETSSINKFEDNWLITTNMRKFKLLDFESRNERTLQHRRLGLNCTTTKEAKILGLTLTTHGIAKHVTNNTNKAAAQLSKLWRFRNLSQDNRRKLYLMLVRPHLIYPCIPLHVTNNYSMYKLQKIQNQGIDFILERRRAYAETSEYRHRLAKLEPINMILQRNATKIWNSIFDDTDEETINNLKPPNCDRNLQNSRLFPSSLEKRNSIATPFFTSRDERWQQ